MQTSSFQEESTIWVSAFSLRKWIHFSIFLLSVESKKQKNPQLVFFWFPSVAINLIVQHIQDILNGEICKWQRGSVNGQARALKRVLSEQGDLQNGSANAPGKRVLLEPSSRPHWDCIDLNRLALSFNRCYRLYLIFFFLNVKCVGHALHYFKILPIITCCRDLVLQRLSHLTAVIGALPDSWICFLFLNKQSSMML